MPTSTFELRKHKMFNSRIQNICLILLLSLCITACGNTEQQKNLPGSENSSGTTSGAPSGGSATGGTETSKSNEHGLSGTKEPSKQSVTLSESIAKRINVQAEPVEERVLGDDLHITGHIAPDVGKETDVATRFSGRVIEVKVKPGDYVKSGQVLAVIDSHELSSLQAELIEAQSKLRIAQAHEEREKQIFEENILRPKSLNEAKTRFESSKVHLDLALSDFKRVEDLHKEKIAAEKDYLASHAAYEKAKLEFKEAQTELQREQGLFRNRGLLRRDLQLAEAETARERQHLQTLTQRLELSGMNEAMIKDLLHTGKIVLTLPVRARLNGIITHQDVSVGELVGPDKHIFTITDLTSVLVVADLPEVDLSGIKIGSPVKVKVSSLPNEVFPGKISYISDTVNAETRTLAIRAVLDNRARKFKVNMFADIELKASPRKVIACPKSAVQEHDGKKIVFIRKGTEFSERHVELGVDNEHYFEVLSGLKPGEEVVTQGSLMLRTELLQH